MKKNLTWFPNFFEEKIRWSTLWETHRLYIRGKSKVVTIATEEDFYNLLRLIYENN